MPRKEHAQFRPDAVDAQAGNQENLITIDTVFKYQWKSERGFHFFRGRAHIYHSENHNSNALELAECFRQLGYMVQLFGLHKIITNTGIHFYFYLSNNFCFNFNILVFL